jgi:DNA-binding SARP family transcriptional activator
VLGFLLPHASRMVSFDMIAEGLWGGAPPATWREQVQADISALRKAFKAAGLADEIVTMSGGYLLRVEEGALDAQVFDARVAQARAAAANGELASAARHFQAAQRLWRGPAFAGLNSAFVESVRAGLDERRLNAYEQSADIELALGRHAYLVAELVPLVRAHPLRESLVSKLMMALYRSGRQADALQAARDLRKALAEQEGLDPGREFVELERAMLRADPTIDVPVPAPVPVRRQRPGASPSDGRPVPRRAAVCEPAWL